jgi:hypothetical protein
MEVLQGWVMPSQENKFVIVSTFYVVLLLHILNILAFQIKVRCLFFLFKDNIFTFFLLKKDLITRLLNFVVL